MGWYNSALLILARQVHESVLIQQNRNHILLNSRSEFNRYSIPRLTVKLGDKEMTELAISMRAEQKKEDELERTIRDLKKQSKKRPGEQHAGQQGNKRMRRDQDYCNYDGSQGCLFSWNSTSEGVSNYDDCVEIALDEAIKLCDDIDEERAQNCGDTQNCDESNCGDEKPLMWRIVEMWPMSRNKQTWKIV